MRRALVLCAGAVAAAALGSPALAAGTEEQLAQKYAPVVRLVEQTEECGHGEPYQPTDVNAVLGNDEVVLRGPWDTTNVVQIAPTAADLAGGKFGYALDFPGDPLNPGCSYEQWSRRITEGTSPTTYARVVTEPGRPNKLALQYWFFYVFNDFNNKHEGDWEMVQLLFDAPDAAAALERRPTSIGYSQHSGAERADWGDKKLELVAGTHPVVYPASGSHANYFESALYLGRSGAEGVGCDETEGPSRDVRPAVAVVPSDEAAYLKAYPWLGYGGQWGEKQPGFYNGPTGPNLKQQWTEPISWAEETWRDQSFAIPAGNSFGPTATGFFCGAVAAGSDLLTRLADHPLPTLLVLGAIVALLVFLASRTTWRQSAPLRLGRRRAWGELLNSSRRMYRGRFRLFAGIGLLFVPFGIVISLVQYLLFQVFLFAPLVDSAGESNAAPAGLALGLGLLFTILGLTIVQAATARAMAELDGERRVNAISAYRLVLHRLPALLRGLVRAAIVVVVLDLTVIGIPASVWLLVRWSLLAQVVVLEEHPARGLLRRSSRLVRGHWWKVATITLVVTGIGAPRRPAARRDPPPRHERVVQHRQSRGEPRLHGRAAVRLDRDDLPLLRPQGARDARVARGQGG